MNAFNQKISEIGVVPVIKLPAHAIGQAAVNSLRRCGVDTSKIVRGGDGSGRIQR